MTSGQRYTRPARESAQPGPRPAYGSLPRGVPALKFPFVLSSLFRIAGVLAALYLAVCALAWRYQDRLAFPSPRTRLPDPYQFRMRDVQRISVTASDGVVLRGWYLAPIPQAAKGMRAPGLEIGRAHV